jgi:D-psicose/D-tagatose/L-ribulose 3-epimerase
MRLSFSNIAWTAQSDDAALATLRNEGYRAVEVAPTRLWDSPLERSKGDSEDVRRTLERAGFRIVAMQSLLYQRSELQIFGDVTTRQALHDHLLGMARLGAELGASRLVFGSPTNRRRGDLPMTEAMERAVEFFRPLGEQAAELGVAFCIEANPREYGCDFLTSATESNDLVRATDTPGIRLHLDTACMALAGDDAAEQVRSGIDVLAHVHISAPQLGAVGPGDTIDHSAMAGALREHGYEGHVSVEMRPQPEQVLSLGVSASFVRRVYSEQ